MYWQTGTESSGTALAIDRLRGPPEELATQGGASGTTPAEPLVEPTSYGYDDGGGGGLGDDVRIIIHARLHRFIAEGLIVAAAARPTPTPRTRAKPPPTTPLAETGMQARLNTKNTLMESITYASSYAISCHAFPASPGA